uniref:C-type lectin domain-containing protein n=1 Tax=Oreochromis aureus TaxID=47969 RepID=A0A668S681_OREAU
SHCVFSKCSSGGTPCSRHSNSSRRSKVMAERVALVVLSRCSLHVHNLLKLQVNKLWIYSFKHLCPLMMIKETVIDTETVTWFVPAGQKDLCFNIFKGDPCSKCEEGWEQHGGKCYYFSTNKSSWNESRDDCRAKGGDLVKIDNKFWIGLTDSAEQGRWLWVDGLSYWNYYEPDNWPEDDCVLMGDKGDRYLKSWSDTSCKVSRRSICEKPAAKGQNKTVCV